MVPRTPTLGPPNRPPSLTLTSRESKPGLVVKTKTSSLVVAPPTGALTSPASRTERLYVDTAVPRPRSLSGVSPLTPVLLFLSTP